jgi:hypothetical protein
MRKELVELFKPYLENPKFKEVLKLVKMNSKGKIWIIGGYLYKNLASALYGIPPYDYDIDFIVEEKNEILKNIPGWQIVTNKYGNPNYMRSANKMSFIDIHKVYRVSGPMAPNIESCVSETPLNVQSIAYDIKDRKIIGDIGMESLKEKVVRVNNFPQAQYYAKTVNKPLEDIIMEKAAFLNFKAIL